MPCGMLLRHTSYPVVLAVGSQRTRMRSTNAPWPAKAVTVGGRKTFMKPESLRLHSLVPCSFLARMKYQ